jgi:hypothetical protein
MANGWIRRGFYTYCGRHDLNLDGTAPHDAAPTNLDLELDSALDDDHPQKCALISDVTI